MTEENQDFIGTRNEGYPAVPVGPSPTAGGRGSRVWKVSLFSLAILLALYLTSSYLASYILEPAGYDPQPVAVTIPQGATTAEISRILWNQGLIKSPVAFKIYSRIKGYDNQLQAGEYLLASTMSTPQILETIAKGAVATFTFTVPEGYSTRQIADLLASKGYINRERFMALVATGDFNYSFLAGLPNNERRLEGYLFPETYRLGLGAPEEKIIDTMLKEFARRLPEDFADKADKLGLTLHEAVTIASIIEREAKKPEEQPLISAVIQNRLKKKMRLEIDATVQYLLPKQKARLLYQDLKIDSPYNTYRYAGLPPGPISSPGKGALEAAVNPAPVDYLYFVVRGDGSHVFTDNYQEHLANIRKYRK